MLDDGDADTDGETLRDGDAETVAEGDADTDADLDRSVLVRKK
jgi:hypothetical protein